jgi:arsenate reductase-like glutaredoxin family protein
LNIDQKLVPIIFDKCTEKDILKVLSKLQRQSSSVPSTRNDTFRKMNLSKTPVVDEESRINQI